jgi:hypothetical protein
MADKRWITLQTYCLGAHRFQIQSRDKDARTLQYRLRWINDASGITTVLRDDLETEGGARYELLRKLEAWSRSKQFIFKGKLR